MKRRRAEDIGGEVKTSWLEEHLKDVIPTKRDVVGLAARIFDPLGVVAPTAILCKMFFQARQGRSGTTHCPEIFWQNGRDSTQPSRSR